MKDEYVTHTNSRFWLALAVISVPLLFPFGVGLYVSQKTGEGQFIWLGVATSLLFIVSAWLFEKTIRREGAADGWLEAYEKNGKPLRIGEPYPGWSFPKFPD
jgi:hypothetical protein